MMARELSVLLLKVNCCWICPAFLFLFLGPRPWLMDSRPHSFIFAFACGAIGALCFSFYASLPRRERHWVGMAMLMSVAAITGLYAYSWCCKIFVAYWF